jgi:hypothetical protein
LKYWEDGSIGPAIDDLTVSNAVAWTPLSGSSSRARAELLVTSLVAAGWASRELDGSLRLHAWNNHAGKLLKSQEKAKERKRKQRAKEDAVSQVCHGPVTVTDPPDIEGKGRDIENEGILYAPTSTPTSQPESPIFLQIPLNRKNEHHLITEAMVTKWEELFPSLDVKQALRNLLAWNLANPKKRKTASGISNHIVYWLGDDQNKGKNQRQEPRDPMGFLKFAKPDPEEEDEPGYNPEFRAPRKESRP